MNDDLAKFNKLCESLSGTTSTIVYHLEVIISGLRELNDDLEKMLEEAE